MKDKKVHPSEARALAPELQGHIGKKLKATYDELVKEPVPDEILNVLKQLEAKERGGSKA